MKKIIDFFPYFDPTGKEILELRINMLKDYVDEFISSLIRSSTWMNL